MWQVANGLLINGRGWFFVLFLFFLLPIPLCITMHFLVDLSLSFSLSLSLSIYLYQKRPAGKKGTYENQKKPRGTQRIKNVLGARHPFQRQEATAQENGTDGALFLRGVCGGGGIYIT